MLTITVNCIRLNFMTPIVTTPLSIRTQYNKIIDIQHNIMLQVSFMRTITVNSIRLNVLMLTVTAQLSTKAHSVKND